MKTMYNSPLLYMLIGAPGCGKSDYRKSILRNRHAVVLSTDQYIEDRALGQGTTYGKLWSTLYKEAEKKMNEKLKEAIADGVDIIWDQTNLSVHKRKEKLKQIPDTYYKIGVVFHVPKYELERVNTERKSIERHIPPHILDDMYFQSLTPVHKADGFDMLITIER